MLKNGYHVKVIQMSAVNIHSFLQELENDIPDKNPF